MQHNEISIADLWDRAWDLLIRGKNDAKHPFSLPVTATTFSTLHPSATLTDRLRSRTLVLRNALKSEAELWCYTDRRSGKAQDLAHPPGVMTWTFWTPQSRIQVTASGPTGWLNAARTSEIFSSLPKHSRKAYATTLAPGTPVDLYTSGLPGNWEDLSLAETDYARENFGVLVTSLRNVEVLELHRDGHRRMRATRPSANQEWNFSWLIP